MSADGERFGRSLGNYLRAHRMRYGELRNLGAFMRLSIVGDGVFRAELVPDDAVPPSAKGRRDDQPYVMWYVPGDGNLRPDMERLCARVLAGEARPVRLKKPVAFLFGNDGEFKGWAK